MKALVTKSTGLWYEVMADSKMIARLRGKLKLDEKKITNPVAVGDFVEVVPNDQIPNEWIIESIYPRSNYVIRQSPRRKGFDHLLASNIDQGVLIVTLKMPRTSVGFIDRFLITLEAFRIPGVILFNKSDLYKRKELEHYYQLERVYSNIGYQVQLMSLESNVEDIKPLKDIFMGKTSMLSGHSGAGKSTLINKMIADADQAINPISDFANKGVHTTTYAELFQMDHHSMIIDTPGIKELGLSEIESEELSHFFPEMRNFLGQCKFHNCLHYNEPGCIIKESVGKEIDPGRYESYVSILMNEDNRR